MSITTRCRRCGREYDADRAAILVGPRWWRLCPTCRGPLPPTGGVPVADGGRPTRCLPEAA